MSDDDNPSIYKIHPQTCDPDDFWGQVRRTVNGRPVAQDQIDLIVEAMIDALNLRDDDCLLDLCCGNGALTTYFFQHCRGGLGIDFSDYLIKVARKNFVHSPDQQFELADVMEFARSEPRPERFTKALCYGSLQYLRKEEARELLTLLRHRFCGLQRLVIGNYPDKDARNRFFYSNECEPEVENSHWSAIGIWRSRDEFIKLGSDTGWRAEFRIMPEEFYAAHYRYDIVLTP